MNRSEREKMVLAMEFIARQCNDEEVFWNIWGMCGVADGDIPYGTWKWSEDIDDYYLGDDQFYNLMTCFLRTMFKAWNSGGLYCDGITSADKTDFNGYK